MPPKKVNKDTEGTGKSTTLKSKSKSTKTLPSKLNKSDKSSKSKPGTKDKATAKDETRPKGKPKGKNDNKGKGKESERDEREIEILDFDNNIIENANTHEIKSDYRTIMSNYDPLKNISSNKLSIYEATMIIAKRKTQLAYNVEPLVEYSEYDNIEEIVIRELKEKKIPFMIKRTIGDVLEYWRIDDMVIDEELFSVLH
jgi:DNA-directed RNA polymerase I, II, and III subunit RPABC2